MSYDDTIKRTRKDLDVITRNSDVYPAIFANGFAWGEAYVISAENPQHDTEDVYKAITEDNVVMLKQENELLKLVCQWLRLKVGTFEIALKDEYGWSDYTELDEIADVTQPGWQEQVDVARVKKEIDWMTKTIDETNEQMSAYKKTN